MLKIGLTGGIGSGKSTVAKIFAQLGVPIYEADARAKNIIKNNIEVKNSLIALFGNDTYVNNEYNSVLVSKMVFEKPELLQKLNNIVHPAVFIDFENWAKRQNCTFVLKEAALMQKNNGLDKIIVVQSPLDLRIERIKKRDPQRSISQIEAIIKNQKSEEEFAEMADYIINNNENQLLIPQVLELIKKF